MVYDGNIHSYWQSPAVLYQRRPPEDGTPSWISQENAALPLVLCQEPADLKGEMFEDDPHAVRSERDGEGGKTEK